MAWNLVQRAVVLAALFAALVVGNRLGITDLLAWTDRVSPTSRYPVLFAALFTTWLGAQLWPARRRHVLLAGSLCTAALFDVWFLAFSIGWLAVLHRILFAAHARRIAYATGFVVASAVVLALVADDGLLIPGTLRVRPDAVVVRWGYIFAVAYCLRLVSLLHQVHVQRVERMPFADLLLYFVFAPFFVILPYCLAIPRCDRLRAGLERHDVAIERSGMRMIAWGLGLACAHAVLVAGYDARAVGAAAARAGDYGAAFCHGIVMYFVYAVLVGTSIAAILVGMVRVLGIDLGPSMNAPLLSTSVVEWWRRWNTHFRDLLVDVFYYPVVMRLRRKKTLAVIAGCASVFLIGSSLLHWPKHYFRTGTWWPLGAMAENVVMFVMVAIAMSRPARKHTGARAVLGAACTWLMVYVAVVVVGYSVAHLTLGRL